MGTFQNVSVKVLRICKFIVTYIFIIWILCIKQCMVSLTLNDFHKIKNDSILVTVNQLKFSRSLVDCGQHCTLTNDCCGFNYYKLDRSCTFLYDVDFFNPTVMFLAELEMSVYIHKMCEHLLQTTTTSTATAATATTSPTTATPTPTTTSTTGTSPTTTTSTPTTATTSILPTATTADTGSDSSDDDSD